MSLITEEEFERSRRKELRRKRKGRHGSRNTASIAKVIGYSDDNYCIFDDGRYGEVFRSTTAPIDFINQNENNKHMSFLATLYRMYDGDIKQVGLAYHTNTTELQNNWMDIKNKATTEEQRLLAREQQMRFKVISESQLNQEYYFIIYGEDIQDLVSKIKNFKRASIGLVEEEAQTKDQKIKLFTKLNNQNTFI
ncbi:hypothetical protein [Staphylococcus sp. RIT622]|uniref:hypothetical protein n=1 Tax=Staphylococcus sp. RIT622 TaxID=2510795 RepID=UPI00101E2E52|nr:hypothetical protein [Staphylococcus sp. RIT622]MCG2544223.1 hypothetical protein [Staphylococcus epidermidis]RYL09499.1 hypothetical protein EU553_11705 [Staphylococcus sp. RIT622]